MYLNVWRQIEYYISNIVIEKQLLYKNYKKKKL